MKKFNFKWLLLSIILSIASINTVWATSGTFYGSPVYMFRDTWNNSTSTMYIKSTTDKDGGGHIEVGPTAMENTRETYHGFPVYSYSSLSSSSDWAEIILYDYKNGASTNSYGVFGDNWSDNFNNVINKLYLGWDGDSHECISSPTYDTPETVTLYYVHENTQNYTIKANMRISDTYNDGAWRTIVMSPSGNTFDGKPIYSCQATIYRGGLQTLQFQRYNGDDYVDQDETFNSWNATSTFENKVYVNGSGWKPMGAKRSYDGNTYIYWKTSGNNIPSDWNEGSETQSIQLLQISNGNYSYTGFEAGDEIEGSNFVRYLVPAGDYANIVELHGKKNDSYSGEFGFPSGEENEIWNYARQGGWGTWAHTYFAKDAYVYFDNTNSEWSTESGYNYLLAGGGGYSALYGMSPISNTELLCHTSSWSYNDFLQLVFIHTSGSWSGTDGNPDDRKTYADYRTASLPKLMDHSSNLYNLYVPSDAGAKASTEASLTHSANSSYGALLNADQTINTVVKTTGSYTSANSKAPISLGSYYLNSATTSTSSSASLTIGESTDKVTACKTATTTFTVDESNMATGYQFDGWFAAATGGSALETNATYSYATNGAKTVYARFSAINYNVTYSAPTNGNYTIKVADGTASSATKTAIIGQTITLAAIPNAGYALQSWTVTKEGGGTVEVTDNTFTMPAENVTVTAAFYVRYGLYGSLDADGNPTNGMPGWSESKSFTYSDGTYTTSVSLDKPNSIYKFRILDRRDNTSWGLSSKAVISENTATTLDNTAADAQLATAGRGSYTLTVVENGSPTHPRVTISNPTSYLVTLGVKSVNEDGSDAGDLGGAVTATDAAGNTYASGSYIASGETVTVTAGSIPTGYHFVGWWNSSAYSSGAFSTDNPTSWTVDGAVNAYVKFIEDTNTFSAASGSNWNTIANWSAGHVPAITDVVYITAPVTVDIANAKAKRVYIDQSSAKTGKLTVGAGKALVVAATIQKINSSSEIVATEETDIVLQSDGTYGTGALVAGSESTTTKATVHFYSKAKKDGSGNYINQYFGTPMDSVSKLNYYGSYLRKFDQPSDSWVSITEEKLGPWTAYRIMRDEESEGTYQIGGTLLLPGTGAGKTKTLTVNTSLHDGDNMFANSWAAPIYIPAMADGLTTPDFSGVTATIYIYNAGSLSDYTYGSTYADKTASPGQWVCLPVLTVASDKVNYLTVIPSQQAFLVQTSTGGSLTLDYKKHVYDPAVASGATIVPTYAPQRTQDNDLEKMRLYLAGESGASDRLMMYMREDFSSGFDDGWEGFKLPGSEFVPQLCAYSDAGEMSINAINDAEGTVLGFYAGTEDSEYTFTFGYEGNDVWYLNDLEAQQSTLISAENSYEFSAVPGTVAERRFVISHTPIAHVPTGIDNSAAIEGVKARKQMINGILYIIRGGQVYSTDGQIVK